MCFFRAILKVSLSAIDFSRWGRLLEAVPQKCGRMILKRLFLERGNDSM